jgi:Zn-dependent metalloprotease
MENISQSQHVCSAIPDHILRRVAERTDHENSQRAKDTLVQMKSFVVARDSHLLQPPITGSFRKRRNVYDAGKRQQLPGKLVMSEHTARGRDVEVNEAYDGSGATHDFYANVLGRNSIDGNGMRLDSTVHYGKGFDNAMWNGRQMVYGDGDGKLFRRFTAALDVIAHELTHGVTQFSSSLGYQGQTGALNEHLSDAFGIMVKQYKLGLSAYDSDWLIGVGLFGPAVQGRAVRSMKAPGTAYDDPVIGRDPQPAHMSQYNTTTDDNGGVHVNSGIPNHAFYLAAVAIGGMTWEVLGKVWYETLTTMLSPGSQFQDFASATVTIAGKRHGIGGAVQTAILDAWAQVGITVPSALSKSPAIHAVRSLLPASGPLARLLAFFR